MKVYTIDTKYSTPYGYGYKFSDKRLAESYCEFLKERYPIKDKLGCDYEVVEHAHLDDVYGPDKEEFGLWLLDKTMGNGNK